VYLLDTDVISSASPVSSGAESSVSAWLHANAGRSAISVVTLGEIQFGVSRLLERGASRKAAGLRQWLELVHDQFADRCLPVDADAARRAGELLVRAEARGVKPTFEDACIAATGDLHGLLVVTFNLRHFEAFATACASPTSLVEAP